MFSYQLIYFINFCCIVLGLREPLIVTADSFDENTAPTPEMARMHGYTCMTHNITTEDGFELGVHRIPGGRSHPLNQSLLPVLLHHGLLDSSADWLMNGPDKSLAYLLADQGYDVWLGNARGNTYSRNHRTLHSSDPKFWNWTWHEMGYYDLPAVIDHILRVTGHSQILYVGHSMGTTMFFVMCSTRPEYNAKVRYMSALAPVAFLGHATSPIRYLAPIAWEFEKIADFFGHGEFLPRSSIITRIFKISCELFKYEEEVCENFVFIICGHDPAQFDMKLLPMILGHNPSGASTKTMVHYAQLIRTNRFQQYDYGSKENMKLYNSTKPPEYNLSRVTVPVTMYYGDNDLLATPMDVINLHGKIKNPVGLFRVNLSSFNHLDFLWARDVKPLVYNKLEALLSIFNDPNTRCVDFSKTKLFETSIPTYSNTFYCMLDSLKETVDTGKSQFKYLVQKTPFWKYSFFSKLQKFTDQLKSNVISA